MKTRIMNMPAIRRKVENREEVVMQYDMSMDEVFAMATEYAEARAYKSTGIYFLILDSQIIYIGQAVNISRRLREHRSPLWGKDFDKVSVLQCPLEYLDVVEWHFIDKYKPKGNRA